MGIKKIEDLRPDPRNANKGTPRGHGVIEQSVRQRGAGRSGLAARDGTMIAGSQTLQKMAELGIPIRPVHTTGDEWVVVIRDDIEPGSDQAALLAVEDNRSSEVGLDWDAGVLTALAEETDISALFRDDELAAILAQIEPPDVGGAGDDFDATPEEGPTRSQVGDLWHIGPHRLLVGDCTDPAMVDRLMGSDRIDCVFTSPPYDQQRTYEGNMRADWRALVSGAMLVAVEHCEDDAQLFVNLGLVHRDGRVIRYWDDFIADMEDGGWPLFGWYVWDKLNGMPGDWNGRFAPAHEWVFHFCREALRPRKTVKTKHEGARVGRSQRECDGSLKSFTQAGVPIQPFKIPDSVVRLTQQRPDELINEHPAVFPVALPETFMQAYAGDIWYEPFCGSGTSIIAAHQSGHRCFGMEISPRYADVCLRRAEAANLPCSLAAGLPVARQP